MKHSKVAGLALLSLCAAVACAQGTASDDISIHESVVLPGVGGLTNELEDAGIPPPTGGAFTLPPQTFNFDASNIVSKLGDFGTVSVYVKSSTLSNQNLDFVESVLVQLQPQDGSLPTITLTDYTLQSETSAASINLPVATDQLVKYLEYGPEMLTVSLTVNSSELPPQAVNLDYDLTLGVSISTSQTIGKIVKGN
jgi:hypothetical protein